jgi:hypothetical protein
LKITFVVIARSDRPNKQRALERIIHLAFSLHTPKLSFSLLETTELRLVKVALLGMKNPTTIDIYCILRGPNQQSANFPHPEFSSQSAGTVDFVEIALASHRAALHDFKTLSYGPARAIA